MFDPQDKPRVFHLPPGVDFPRALIDGLRRHGHRHVVALDDPSGLATEVAAIVRPGDVVLCLGAGSITTWAHALPGELAALLGEGTMREAQGR